MKIPIFNSIYNGNDKFIFKHNETDLNKLNRLDLKDRFKKFPIVNIIKYLPEYNSLFETIIVSANDELAKLFLTKIKFTDISKKLMLFIKKPEFKKYKLITPKNVDEIVELNNYVRLVKPRKYINLFMIKKISIFLFIFVFLISLRSYASELKKSKLSEIKEYQRNNNNVFQVKINQDINEINLNNILKDLYNSNFFDNVRVELNENALIINVVESPIIENISYNGIKANKIRNAITQDLKLKSRSSYNEFLLQADKKKILSVLKDLGYYYSNIETIITDMNDNKISTTHNIELGEKAKIKRLHSLEINYIKTENLEA